MKPVFITRRFKKTEHLEAFINVNAIAQSQIVAVHIDYDLSDGYTRKRDYILYFYSEKNLVWDQTQHLEKEQIDLFLSKPMFLLSHNTDKTLWEREMRQYDKDVIDTTVYFVRTFNKEKHIDTYSYSFDELIIPTENTTDFEPDFIQRLRSINAYIVRDMSYENHTWNRIKNNS